MLDATALAVVGSGLLLGFLSAVTALVPIEVYVLSVAATQPSGTAVAAAVAAAAGQTVGKVLVATAARGAVSVRWFPRRQADDGAEALAVLAPDVAVPGAVGAPAAAAAAGPAPAPVPERAGRLRRWFDAVNRTAVRWLRSRWAPAVVVVSGVVGVPPLLLLAVAAGLTGMPLPRFAVACFAGRTGRFLALALVPGAAGLVA